VGRCAVECLCELRTHNNSGVKHQEVGEGGYQDSWMILGRWPLISDHQGEMCFSHDLNLFRFAVTNLNYNDQWLLTLLQERAGDKQCWSRARSKHWRG
jgi:hypothetical protein